MRWGHHKFLTSWIDPGYRGQLDCTVCTETSHLMEAATMTCPRWLGKHYSSISDHLQPCRHLFICNPNYHIGALLNSMPGVSAFIWYDWMIDEHFALHARSLFERTLHSVPGIYLNELCTPCQEFIWTNFALHARSLFLFYAHIKLTYFTWKKYYYFKFYQ
jgi:hypothetical protein